MAKSLVIVESPAKANTINKFLGSQYAVRSSMGHIKDLPTSKMGVDVEHDFKPQYITIPERKKVITQIKKELAGKTDLYLAADPDREGEAICWHIANTFAGNMKVHRVVFHEITKEAILEAFSHPRSIDMNMVNAQQARRILDRIVGYSLSPLLWRKVGRGLSAGRVQSVALRLIVDREQDIRAFKPQEYWEIEAELKKHHPPDNDKHFSAKLDKIDGKEPAMKDKKQADAIVADLNKARFVVAQVNEGRKLKKPQAPFTTSKLQQEAFNKLRFPAEKTMRIAQQLYEGVQLGKQEQTGLITYMRTDSVNVSKEATDSVRGYILKKFGREYLPSAPNRYKAKKSAQEAHEAIRPSSVHREPGQIEKYLTPDQNKLYELIWNRFLASQMKPAVYSVMTVDISAKACPDGQAREGKYMFRASSTRCVFAGFTKVYQDASQEEPPLPPLKKDDPLDLIKLIPSQHFTKPPARFSDATLIKALEEDGIGRPSTYVPIIETIVTRDYVRRISGYLHPTELGIAVTDLLVKHFPEILDVKFTAEMEDELDEIEIGKLDWVSVLRQFYGAFDKTLKKANVNMKAIKKEVVQTDQICDKCGKPMVIKWGRNGKFLSCSAFPVCRNAKSLPTGVKCPKCGGDVVQRRSRKGSVFFGCSNYPNCDYLTRRLPRGEAEALPKPDEAANQHQMDSAE
jgi:DNA topoisomerase-1